MQPAKSRSNAVGLYRSGWARLPDESCVVFRISVNSAPIPHVEGWYVEPTARTCGVGRALMDCAEAWARDQGFTELASDTEIHNAGSLAAHERCGFVETERLVKLRKPLA
ncbi:MAG: GNAT family N-acetyltransferase [Candidatus Cybelea sp.]